MDEIQKIHYHDCEILAPLGEIPDPPKELYLRGTLPSENTTLLTVIGSRKYSSYGRDACQTLIGGLAGFPISIVSGLALGIDSIAHRAALDNNLHTIAVPGSGLDDDVLYPREHVLLANEIIEVGGAIISEYEPDFRATSWSFPRRNRIMAGLGQATLVAEAEKRSGTLITAKLALDFGRDVFVVPGSIFSETSKGTHWLLREGATPITTPNDLITALGYVATEAAYDDKDHTAEEKAIMEHLREPLTREVLASRCPFSIEIFNRTISLLEIKGHIREEGGVLRKN